MFVNADFHIHSSFSIGTSPSINLFNLISACKKKGIQVLGSGDALHPQWRKQCIGYQEQIERFLIIPSAEIEDHNRIHHLILMEDFISFENLEEAFQPHSNDLTTNGRPHLALNGGNIAEIVHELGGLIGPAHAFTPWTALYAKFDHIDECYHGKRVDFLELGLSADSSYGAAIPELYSIPFISNSDAHSFDFTKLGREWNHLNARKLSPKNILKSVRKGEIIYNAGLFPEGGKYNRTGCSRCHRLFSFEEAIQFNWRCPNDGGKLKKGVFDRCQELSIGASHPRPHYYHMIPLAEIIQKVMNTSSPKTKNCINLYTNLIDNLGCEIDILIERTISEICSIHKGVAKAIEALRNERVCLHPGGGGQYGTFYFEKK